MNKKIIKAVMLALVLVTFLLFTALQFLYLLPFISEATSFTEWFNHFGYFIMLGGISYIVYRLIKSDSDVLDIIQEFMDSIN